MDKVFEAKALPVLQNRVYSTYDEAISCKTGDVSLKQDDVSGVISNRLFDPSKITYDALYDNEQSHSDKFNNHLEDVLSIIKKIAGNKKVLEIGCGKGVFLEKLRDNGLDVTGVDPTYEGEKPYVIKEFYTGELGVTADIIVLRHVLEHIPNPHQFLMELAEANLNQGIIYIEVPDFNWIVKNNTWFDVFYEHVNYFTPEDFDNIFGVTYEQGIFFGGQYQYVVCDLSTIKSKVEWRKKSFDLSYKNLDILTDLLHSKSDKKIGIWGGASKGIISALYLTRNKINIDYIVDINPRKQEKYAPVTGIKIISPKSAVELMNDGDIMLIANGNYGDEIKLMSNNKFTYLSL